MERNLEIFKIWHTMQFLDVMSDLMYMMGDRVSIENLILQLRADTRYSTSEKIAYLSMKAIEYKRLGSPIAAMHTLFGACQIAVHPAIIAEIYHLMFSYYRHIGTGNVDRVMKALDIDLNVLKAPEMVRCKAQLQIKLGEYTAAEGTLKEGLELAPHDPSLTKLLAELYAGLKQIEKAEELIDAYLKKKSKDAPILFVKAKLAFNKGDFDSALKLFKKVSKIDKSNLECRLLIPVVYQQKNELKHALQFINDMMVNKQQDDKSWRNIGTYYSNINAFDLAVYALEKAIKYNANEPEYVRDLTLVYSKKGDIDKAIGFAESKVRRFKKSDRIARILGDLYLGKHDYDKAEMYTKRALEVKPNDPFLVIMLGDVFYSRGDHQKAEEEFKRAIEMNKSNPEINVRVAQVYLKVYDFDKAEAHFKAAIGMIPNYEPAVKGLKLLEYLSTKKVSVQKLYDQLEPQFKALASDELPPSKDGRVLSVNLLDALVDEPDSEE